MTISPLAIGTIATTLATLTTLIVLFFWTTNNLFVTEDDNNGDNDYDDGNGNNGSGDGQWWDNLLDMKREEQAELKVAVNLLFLGISCGSLFVPMSKIWHPTKGVEDRYNLGVLAASMFLAGNGLFVSFWYSANFAQQEDDNDNDNGNDDNDNYDYDDANDDNYQMDQEELLAYHQKVVSITSLILALALSATSVCIYTAGHKLPETTGHHHGSTNNGEDAHAVRVKSAAHTQLFSEIWNLLSACTLVVFSILFIVACVLSLGEDAERMREEGGINLLVVLLWMIGVTLCVTIAGRQILRDKTLGTLGVGLLSGGTLYYALLLFLVSTHFASVSFGGPNDGGGGPTAATTSFVCFFLSLVHLAFSLGVRNYRISILVDARAREEMDDSVADGDFRRMKDEAETKTVMMYGKETVMELI